MGGTFAVDWKMIGIVLSTSFIFGLFYNNFVGWLGKRKEGYLGPLVVGGVTVVLVLSAFLIGLINTLLVAACFVAAGTPMAIGEIYRSIQARELALQEEREKAQRIVSLIETANDKQMQRLSDELDAQS